MFLRLPIISKKYSNLLKQAIEEGLIVKAIMLKMDPKSVKFIKEIPINI